MISSWTRVGFALRIVGTKLPFNAVRVRRRKLPVRRFVLFRDGIRFVRGFVPYGDDIDENASSQCEDLAYTLVTAPGVPNRTRRPERAVTSRQLRSATVSQSAAPLKE